MLDSYNEIKLAYNVQGGGDLSAPDFVEHISIYSATVNSIIVSVVF